MAALLARVPFRLGGVVKEVVKAGVITIGAEHFQDIVVHAYHDYVEQPLNDFVHNLPSTAVYGY